MSLIGLGRRLSKDRRDHDYPLPRRRDAARKITQRLWPCTGVLDQGASSACVGHAGSKYLTAGPIKNAFVNPFLLYKEAQRHDEWPGEDYDGTSTRGLFKALKKRGVVKEYRWAFDAETVINHVLIAGPVVVGTLWDEHMSNPDKHGYIVPGDNIEDTEDGHEWLILGAYRERRNPDKSVGACRLLNSWGAGWGQVGRAWVTFQVLDKLIKTNGEACVATEVLGR